MFLFSGDAASAALNETVYEMPQQKAADTAKAGKAAAKPKSKPTAAKPAKDTAAAKPQAKPAKKAEDSAANIASTPDTARVFILIIVSVCFFIVMLYILYRFFAHIQQHGQRIGFQSIKLIGLILILPGICIVALVGDKLIEGSTLAALLGTIAGYVLSKDDDNNEAASAKIGALTKERDEMKARVKDLEKEVEDLKKKGK